MSSGSAFHAAGPACEKARWLNLVRSRGIEYFDNDADLNFLVAGTFNVS